MTSFVSKQHCNSDVKIVTTIIILNGIPTAFQCESQDNPHASSQIIYIVGKRESKSTRIHNNNYEDLQDLHDSH